MDEVVRKIVALGFPGVILLIAMATTGLTGAAAITAALAMLGPGGMIGGIAFLGVVGIAADALSKFGLEAILKKVYQERKQKGESVKSLEQEINKLPISEDLKRSLKEDLSLINFDSQDSSLFDCDDCYKEINVGEPFWSINVHQESFDGEAINVLDAESVFIFCEKCAVSRDFKNIQIPFRPKN